LISSSASISCCCRSPFDVLVELILRVFDGELGLSDVAGVLIDLDFVLLLGRLVTRDRVALVDLLRLDALIDLVAGQLDQQVVLLDLVPSGISQMIVERPSTSQRTSTEFAAFSSPRSRRVTGRNA